MKTRHEFTEVLNDLVDYFILGDISLLESWKAENSLGDDLGAEFTSNESGDRAAREGIVIPMAGIENYPYNILFTLDDEAPEFLKTGHHLQHRRAGYVLKIENNSLLLYTWRILNAFTSANVSALIERYRGLGGRPIIELENGWYDVEILAGELLRNGDFEPAFEFILRKAKTEPVTSQADIDYRFTIRSQTY